MSDLPEGWVETTLGNNIVDIAMGPFGSNLKVDSFIESGVPVIKGGNLSEYFVGGTFSFVSEEKATSLRRSVAHAGDIIITHRGTLGQASLVPTGKYERYVASPSQLRFTPDKQKVDKNYLLYFLKSRIGQYELLLNASQVGVPAIATPTKAIKEINLCLPPLPEQKAIADMLSSFDEKIELLREQNKTLETLAQTIFKEWFVYFNFPDPYGKPYRNNGGKMVESELGLIPQGWRVKTIGELVELIIDYRGKTPKKLGMDWSESGVPALSAKTIKNGKIVRRDAMNLGSKELYDIWMKNELARKDILLTSEAPLGEMYFLPDDAKYILSQRLFALRANKEITSEYLYHYLFSPFGQCLLKSRASGSTVEGIRQSELRKVEVIVPEEEVINKASDVFASVFEKTALNDKQIQSLTKARDTLLPKLMKGEVRVENVMVGEV